MSVGARLYLIHVFLYTYNCVCIYECEVGTTSGLRSERGALVMGRDLKGKGAGGRNVGVRNGSVDESPLQLEY